ncbi:MAG: 2-dehydropantoate 2-reductase [Deltaproteobacteria bacterium]|nr:MAG: 2-dehydropantoate 2-reductase [Deltaproteobacteria bacterium]
MASRTFAIIGTGAVGGYYGARLAQAGFDVSFLVRSDLEHVRRHGLRVLSPEGDVVLPEVQVYGDAAAMPRADVVIVAIKATANGALPAILPHLVRPGGTVVVLQNGLGAEDAIAAAAHPARVVGGLAFLCATRIAPGTIRHVADRLIDLAPWTPDGAPAPPDPPLHQLAADFEQAGIPVRLLDNLALARWRKLVWNIPFGGLCIALDADTRQIVDDPDALAMVRAVMSEVVAAAAACGQSIDPGVPDDMIDATRALPAFQPSLKVDFDAGAALELDALFGNPLRAAQRAGHPAPRIEQLHRQLQFLERSRR